MNYQLHMETLLQMPTHPPNSSDPRESPRQVHPHNKVKKIRRYHNKSFKSTLRHSTGMSQGSLYGLQAQTLTLGCQEAPCDGVVETAEEYTFAQSNKQETGKSQPCAALSRGQNLHYTKISRTAAGFTSLHPDASSVFRKDFQLPERDILNAH